MVFELSERTAKQTDKRRTKTSVLTRPVDEVVFLQIWNITERRRQESNVQALVKWYAYIHVDWACR